MALNWRKWNRAIHRDFGYLFLGMTIIYALSGIAINHMKEWNPNYVVTVDEIQIKPMGLQPERDDILSVLQDYEEADNYKNHYFPSPDIVKVFLEDGTMIINLLTGEGLLERTRRRPVFREVNYLHYNPIKYWTWYSDIFSGALILLGISGILIPRGSRGITRRGAWLTILGFIIPMIYLFIYFY
ncbi:MAG: PepSY-associated TM helix domain-containing protein [bacterium]|jgi:uncharacterized protein